MSLNFFKNLKMPTGAAEDQNQPAITGEAAPEATTAAQATGSTSPAHSDTTSDNSLLLPGQFQFQNMRHWSDLQDTDLEALSFGFIDIVDTVPKSVRPSGRAVSLDEFNSLKRYSLAVGVCRKAHFQYKVFDYNCNQVSTCMNFDEDGTVSFADSSLNDVYTQINALWQNTIASGEKFLRWLEADLEERFGGGSDAVNTWRKAFEAAADISLGIDFCFSNPAMVERDFLFLNMSGVNFEQRRTGFAINMDVGFMDHDLGDSLRAKVITIMKDRKERGLPPQMTVNELTERFHAHVSLLYADYLEIMMRDADKASATVERLIEEEQLNCVIFTPTNGEDALNSPKLVYRIPSPYMVESYLTIGNKVRQKWSKQA